MDELPTYEVEAQYFGFLPTTVIDLVINAVNDYVLLSADSLKSFLLESSSSPFREEPEHVWKAITAVVNFVQDAMDKYFDKFELYCFRNVFKIPEMLPVPGDIPSQQHASSSSSSSLPSSSPMAPLPDVIKDINAELDKHTRLRSELRRLKRKSKRSTKTTLENGVKQAWVSHGGNLLQDHIVYLWEQVDGVKDEAARVLDIVKELERLRAAKQQQSQQQQQTVASSSSLTTQQSSVTSTPGGPPSSKKSKTSRPILPDEVVDSM